MQSFSANMYVSSLGTSMVVRQCGLNMLILSLSVAIGLFQEIDGKALLLLRSDMMMKYMGLKLGPALKLTFHIDKLKQGR